MIVCTHDGIFHADDVMAYAIIKLWAEASRQELELLRSRNPNDWDRATMIFDVGGRNGATLTHHWFDHHQRGGAGKRDNGIPYASAGLVWRRLGHDLCTLMFSLLGYETCREMANRIDQRLIQPIDAADCGVAIAEELVPGVTPVTLSHVLFGFNPLWNEAPNFNPAFEAAAAFAESVLKRALYSASSRQDAKQIVRAAMAGRPRPEILLLNSFCPWQEALFELPGNEEVLYTIFQQPSEARQTWMVHCVPVSPGSFEKRQALPESWAGLRNAAEAKEGEQTIEQVTGVADAVFCHPGRFICGARSKEGALRLAEAALSWRCMAPLVDV